MERGSGEEAMEQGSGEEAVERGFSQCGSGGRRPEDRGRTSASRLQIWELWRGGNACVGGA